MVALHVCQVWWTLAYKPLRTRRHKSKRTLCQGRSVRACVHSELACFAGTCQILVNFIFAGNGAFYKRPKISFAHVGSYASLRVIRRRLASLVKRHVVGSKVSGPWGLATLAGVVVVSNYLSTGLVNGHLAVCHTMLIGVICYWESPNFDIAEFAPWVGQTKLTWSIESN